MLIWIKVSYISFLLLDENSTGFVLRPFTAPFNNMRTLKFRAQPTNPFCDTVNQMFGGSS